MKKQIDYSIYKDRDLSVLAEREKQILLLKVENPRLTNKEIGEKAGVSASNVSSLLHNAYTKMEGTYQKSKAKNIKRKSSRKRIYNVSIFDLIHKMGPDFDSSQLAKRELQVFNLILSSHQPLSNEEISEKLETSIKNIASIIYRLRLKLDTNYAEKYKQIKNTRKKYNTAHKTKQNEYNRKYYAEHHEELSAKQREINKAYYIANRERIIEKQRKKRYSQKNGTTP